MDDHIAPDARLALEAADDGASCRLCPVRCERIVYPAACVSQACPRLYAHEEGGVTWIGCIDKIFGVEIDAGQLARVEQDHPGFGAIRADRPPRPICVAAIDRTFPLRANGACQNPAFGAGLPDAPDGREPLRTRPA